jgi:hypothetical protein
VHRLSSIALRFALVGALTSLILLQSRADAATWHFVHPHRSASDLAETRSFTASGVPGDPLNIAFYGTEEELLTLMTKAGWDPADAITWRSALHIAVASLRRRSYPDAPVSSLYVNGRKQDFAFEQELGDATRRHHVRFWKLQQHDDLGRPLWIGAATRDISIGVSHTNGHPTHHIAPDVDIERNKLVSDIQAIGGIAIDWIDDFQPASEGRNAAGDKFVTDRRLAVISAVETKAIAR